MGATELIALAALIFGPTGAAWVGVKHSLNGTVKRVERIEKNVQRTRREVRELRKGVQEIRTAQMVRIDHGPDDGLRAGTADEADA